jgi:small-conductance mechanosensitive channel
MLVHSIDGTLASFLAFMPAWALAPAVFAAVLAAGEAVRAVLSRLLKARSPDWHPLLRPLFKRTRRVWRYALLLLAVALALPFLPLPQAVEDRLGHFLVAAFVVLLGWAANVAANIGIDSYTGSLKLDTDDNLQARKIATQMRMVRRAVNIAILLVTMGFALMNFETVRQLGISLFASAGIAGIVAGIAARPLFENLIAGMQLALTQPLRLGDAVVIADEWGFVEEITSTYVVVRLWDLRRQIVPLSYLFQTPFTNWTRSSASIIGTVTLYADFTLPVERLRDKAAELAQASPLWDGKVVNVQVTEAGEQAMQIRILVSAADSARAWDLRCDMREKLIAYIRDEYPAALPRIRREDFSLKTQ